MRIIKFFFILYFSILFFSFSIFPFNGPQQDFIVYDNEEVSHKDPYREEFIFDTEKDNIEDFIPLGEDGEVCKPFFTPRDDVLGILVDLINREEKSIKLATFFLTEENIIDALACATIRGVCVEVVAGSYVVNGKYSQGAKKLHAEDANIFEYDPPKRSSKWARGIMHNKFIIFEKNIHEKPLLITGSLNLTHSAFRCNRENICICSKFGIIKNYLDRFEYLKNDCCRCYKSIEDIVKLRNDKICQPFFSPGNEMFRALIDSIHEEKESIKMAVFFLTEHDVIDALEEAIKRGVEVEIVAGAHVVSGKYNNGAKRLQQKGAKIFAYEPPKNSLYPDELRKGIMHHKFIVFKNTVHSRPSVWTGSANFTGSARSYNKENALMCDNVGIVEAYDEKFESIKKFCYVCTQEQFIKKKKPKRKKRKKKTSKVLKKRKEITGGFEDSKRKNKKRKFTN